MTALTQTRTRAHQIGDLHDKSIAHTDGRVRRLHRQGHGSHRVHDGVAIKLQQQLCRGRIHADGLHPQQVSDASPSILREWNDIGS